MHSLLNKGILLFSVVFVLVAPCPILSVQDPPQGLQPALSGQTFRIAGIAISSTTGTPLAGTRVSIFETKSPRNAQWMITAEDGRFAFANLTAGKYSLRGARRGFIPTTYDQHGQFSTAIVTGANVDTENLVLRVVPMAAIFGKVLDESGEPVRNAQMRLYRESRNSGFSQVNSASYAQTDDQGSYEFAPVGPGIYFVSATARPWYATHPFPPQISGAGNSFVDPSLDVSYPTTYYSGAIESEVATPIPVKGGDRVQIDIQLDPVPSLHLLFHNTPDKQNGFRTPVLKKRVFDSVEGVDYEGSSCNQDVCELLGVPAGKYTVQLPAAAPGESGQNAEISLTKDIQDLDFSGGEPLASLKLSVKIVGEQRLPQALSILVRDVRLRVVAFQAVDQNGEAHFENLAAGKYSLLGVTPTRQYVVSQTFTQDSKGSSGGNFTMISGSSLRLSALLMGAMTKVEGFVKRSGKPVPGVMVVLVPDDPESNIELFRRDQSDLDGSFVLPSVAPGSYSVMAIEDGWTLDWSTPAVLARYAPHGQNITVGSQTKDSIHLPDPVEAQPR